jgi:hypothetical protein
LETAINQSRKTGAINLKSPGAYIVRINVDGKLQQQFPVSVKDTIAQAVKDTLITINGPTQGIVNEEDKAGSTGQCPDL